MPQFTLAKVKTFIGNEGHGLNAEIIMDGTAVAFVLDEVGQFKDRCNLSMVELEAISDTVSPSSHLGQSDTALLKSLIENHAKYTGSQRAMDILANWPKWSRLFVKVMPTEYRRALTEIAAKNTASRSGNLKQKAA